jgi:hypothetical protein
MKMVASMTRDRNHVAPDFGVMKEEVNAGLSEAV